MPNKIANVGKVQKLGLMALVATVVSSMICSGVDGLPQNMAANSSLGALAIGWFICDFGMFFISRTFIILSNIRTDLNSGIYMYSRIGFGAFCAFIVAWGNWLMTIFSNVTFGIRAINSKNYFKPRYLQGRNNLASIIGISLLIWNFNFLVLSGICLDGNLNLIGALAKFVPLIVFMFILICFFDIRNITKNIWGYTPTIAKYRLESVFIHIISPLDVALWCFNDVEVAVALSGRAKNKKDVGKATLIGFIILLVICISISILPFGVLSQATLSTIPTHSLVGRLKRIVGEWGEPIINVGVLISLLTSWLAWTMTFAEIPMITAQNGTFPKKIAKCNKQKSFSFSLWISSALMQLMVLLVYFSSDTWAAMLAISGLTVLPVYLMSTAYLYNLCINGDYTNYKKSLSGARISSVIGFLACSFMFYSSEKKYLAMVQPLLTIGIHLFVWKRIEEGERNKISQGKEIRFLMALIALDALIGYLFINDSIIF